jgi:type I restriction enzyme S subunit
VEFYSNWKTGKVVTGKTPSQNNPEQWGEEALFVTPSDMKSDGKYITSTVRRISKEGLQKFKNIFLPINSVMVSCIGSDMGKVTINEEVGITNQQINSIVVDQEKFDNDFVYYSSLSSESFLK